MSFFASKREKRLWLLVLAVVVGIYSTLGLAGMLADLLYNQSLSAAAFLFAMFLIGLTILAHGLNARPSHAEITVALGVAVAYFMLFFRMTMPERSHLIEYGALALLIHEALMERASQGRRVLAPSMLAILATSLVGALDEGIQWFLPNRVFDPIDILFNVLAGGMAVTASAALGWARQRWRRSST